MIMERKRYGEDTFIDETNKLPLKGFSEFTEVLGRIMHQYKNFKQEFVKIVFPFFPEINNRKKSFPLLLIRSSKMQLPNSAEILIKTLFGGKRGNDRERERERERRERERPF